MNTKSVKLYPNWVNTLSIQYGVPKEDLISLYNEGATYEEVSSNLQAQYLTSLPTITEEDYWNLVFEKDITFRDAVKTYEIAMKYKKDPSFIVDLFLNKRDWDTIERAFERYIGFERDVYSLYTKETLSTYLSRKYNGDFVTEIDHLLGIGADIELIRAMVFFVDIYSDAEGEVDISAFATIDANALANLPGEIYFLQNTWPENINSISLKMNNAFTTKNQEIMKTSSSVAGGALVESFIVDNTASAIETSSPFNQYFANTVEIIDPKTGDLRIKQRDFSLPGKNGMDFSFTRLFQTLDSNIQIPDIKGYADTEEVLESVQVYDDEGNPIEGEFEDVWVERECVRYEATPIPANQPYAFGLPFGWTLDGIPLLSKISSKGANVDMGSEGIFSMTFDGKPSGKKKKLSLFKENIILPGGTMANYRLRKLSGIEWYFNSQGRPIACKNRFDEYIWFSYENGNIDTIKDTVGRIVKFNHSSTSLVVEIFESEEGELLQTWEYIFGVTSLGQKTLASIHPEIGGDIEFEYIEETGTYLEYGTCSIKVLTISSVKHPTSGVTHFEYIQSKNSVNMPIFKLKERWDDVPTKIVNTDGTITDSVDLYANRSKYSYTKSYPKEITTKTTHLGESNDVITTETWEYDRIGNIILQKTIADNMGDDRNKKEVIETNYFYSELSMLPTVVGNKTTLFNPDGTIAGEGPEILKGNRYDEYDNVINVVDSLGNRKDFAYENRFNMLLGTKEYFSQSDTEDTFRYHKNNLDVPDRRVVELTTEVMAKQVQDGTKELTCPIVGDIKASTPVLWMVPEIAQSINFKYKWGTGGWGSNSSFKIYIRNAPSREWTCIRDFYYDGNLFNHSENVDWTYILPEKGLYEVKIKKDSGDFILNELSATVPEYQITYISPVKCKGYEYDQNHMGNVTAINTYPLGYSSGAPDSRVEISYDPLWNYAFPSVTSTNVTAADGSQSLVQVFKEYDSLGRVVTTRKEETGVASHGVSYEYDVLGRPTKVINPPHNGIDNSFVEILYEDESRQIISIDELGHQKRSTYDALCRTIYLEWKDSEDEWHFTEYVKYDLLGRKQYAFDALFNETSFEYDNFGRMVKTISADGTEMECRFVDVNLPLDASPSIPLIPPSGFTNLELVGWEMATVSGDFPIYRGYDVLGRTVWTATNPKINPISGVPVWDMTWHEYDRFNRETKSAINRTSTEWDVIEYEYACSSNISPFEMPLAMKLPGTTEPKYIYEFDSRGLKVKEYQEGLINQATTMEYDELGRLMRVNYPSKEEWINGINGLDPNGTASIFNPIEVTATRKDEYFHNIYGITRGDSYISFDEEEYLESSVSLDYNQRGWLVQKSWDVPNENLSYEFTFGYDVRGNRTEINLPNNDKTLEYLYDDFSRISSIPGYFGTNVEPGFCYNENGNLISLNRANGIETTYSYDNLNRVIDINSTPISLNYEYDLMGNISTITESDSQEDSLVSEFTYDKKGQLKTAKTTGEKVDLLRYWYDGAGNRVHEEHTSFETNNEFVLKIGGKFNDSWENILQAHNLYSYNYLPGNYLVNRTGDVDINYAWNNRGQLESKGTNEEYHFNSRNTLSGITKDEVLSEICVYDAFGKRIKTYRADESTLSLPLANTIGYEVVSNNQNPEYQKVIYLYAYGNYLGKILKEYSGQNEEVFFYHGDIIGSVRKVTDISGDIVSSYDFNPFGTMVNSENGNSEPGFTGKKLDSSGLLYFEARYYDSEIGRFISRDPAFSRTNWFIYCNNNPISYVDPTGCVIRAIPLSRENYIRWYGEDSYDENLFHCEVNLNTSVSAFRKYLMLSDEVPKHSSTFKNIWDNMSNHSENINVWVSGVGGNLANRNTEDNTIDVNFNFNQSVLNFKSAEWVFIEELSHAYEHLIGGMSLNMSYIDSEIYTYITYIEPALKELYEAGVIEHPFESDDWDDPFNVVYKEMVAIDGEKEFLKTVTYNKYGNVVDVYVPPEYYESLRKG